MASSSSQTGFDIRFEWGVHALRHLARPEDTVIIVDVLSFTTCVDIACARGVDVFPFPFGDDRAIEFAREQGAILASPRSRSGPSLSPASLLDLAAGTRLILPSPNGAMIAANAQSSVVLAACFRNRSAVARFTVDRTSPILVIAAGERWPDEALRPAVEDLVGAGALIASLRGSKSPEALAAVAAYEAVAADVELGLSECASARELVSRGFASDLGLAFSLDSSDCVPVLEGGRFFRARHWSA